MFETEPLEQRRPIFARAEPFAAPGARRTFDGVVRKPGKVMDAVEAGKHGDALREGTVRLRERPDSGVHVFPEFGNRLDDMSVTIDHCDIVMGHGSSPR